MPSRRAQSPQSPSRCSCCGSTASPFRSTPRLRGSRASSARRSTRPCAATTTQALSELRKSPLPLRTRGPRSDRGVTPPRAVG
eukprot:scaffold77015_cov33-Phaeocystis_antarctica.AAC.1